MMKLETRKTETEVCFCERCEVEMQGGVVLLQTHQSSRDSLGGDCVTISVGEPGELAECLK